MVIAEYICILAYGAEFFVKALTYRKVGRKRPFERHTQRLVDDGIIEAALKDELDWMWGIRTHEHLDATTDLRHCTHGNRDFSRATKAWNEFLKKIEQVGK